MKFLPAIAGTGYYFFIPLKEFALDSPYMDLVTAGKTAYFGEHLSGHP